MHFALRQTALRQMDLPACYVLWQMVFSVHVYVTAVFAQVLHQLTDATACVPSFASVIPFALALSLFMSSCVNCSNKLE